MGIENTSYIKTAVTCDTVTVCLVNELSYQQAGEVLAISVSAVTNLIYRARKTLRALRRSINEK